MQETTTKRPADTTTPTSPLIMPTPLDPELISCDTIPEPQYIQSAASTSHHDGRGPHRITKTSSASIHRQLQLRQEQLSAAQPHNRHHDNHEMDIDTDIDMDASSIQFDEVRHTADRDNRIINDGTPHSNIKGGTHNDAWIPPPGRKLCIRHQRMADEGTNLQLQKSLDSLPITERETVSKIWSSFGSSSHKRRALILQGLLTMCCQSQLSLLSEQLSQINRVDPFSLLPREVSLKVLGFLDAKALTRAAQVSRFWKDLADDDILWKNMCVQHIEKKCTKCGWGLPLLERRILMTQRANADRGSPGPSVGMKRSATLMSANQLVDVRSAKRARSDSPSRMDVANAVASSSTTIPTLPRIPATSPFLRSDGNTTTPSPDPSLSNPLACNDSSPSRPRLTRPWKDVYSERLKIERNWRKGIYTTRVLKGHTDGVMCLQFNEKLSHPSFPVLITGSYDWTVRVWNMETGAVVRTLEGHTRAVRALQFDECKLVTGSMDRTLRLWNWRTGQCIRTLEGHTAGVVCLAFDANVLVSGSVDKTVKVWNFRTGESFTLRGHQDWVNAVQLWDGGSSTPSTPPTSSADRDGSSLDPGKMLFSASDDGTIRLWDLTRRECIRQFVGHQHQVQSIQLSTLDDDGEDEPEKQPPSTPDLESASDPTSRSLSRRTSSSSLSAHSASSPPQTSSQMTPSTSLLPCFKPKNKGATPVLISGSLDNTIKMWDIDSGKLIKTLFGHIEGVWSISTDKLRLVSASHDKTIKIWNRDESKCLTTLVGHRGAVTCTALADDKIVSGSDDGDIRIWNFAPTPLS